MLHFYVWRPLDSLLSSQSTRQRFDSSQTHFYYLFLFNLGYVWIGGKRWNEVEWNDK
jgi:hypothetical protein